MPFNLKSYNTFGLDVDAAYGYVIRDFAMFGMAFKKIKDTGLPFIVLGEGSDVLFTENFNGIVLINRLLGYEFAEDANFHFVKLQAGENFDRAIRTCLSKGIYGLENLALIPGTAGAAPVQNIGAYGSSFSDFCRYVEVLDLENNKLSRIKAEDCEFGYRTSIFKKTENIGKYIITAVELKIPKKWKPNLNYASLDGLSGAGATDIYERISDIRKSKLPDPHIIGNAGSFFKNPTVDSDFYKNFVSEYGTVPGYFTEGEGRVKLAAGWLIEKAGCKGLRMGNAGTYDKQSLIVVNHGGATPLEVVNAARYVRTQVLDKFGIELIPEVRIFGRDGECGL
ncbi:UDP-N-acetylmuramate dehydrogenase [uncultured Ruminobacter sp.]|uniref:UDP-N-acetylmuramate dehydrogenase n=1 Tax=uncultured Ruminobacter sp. TaxID=538947 RepID=UPI0025E9DBDC|nr:UDP-N-acetylmuramate dehydrogenase [uncultured Ruminobacter sp.]